MSGNAFRVWPVIARTLHSAAKAGLGEVCAATYVEFVRRSASPDPEQAGHNYVVGEELWLAVMESPDAAPVEWDLDDWLSRIRRQSSALGGAREQTLLTLAAGTDSATLVPPFAGRGGILIRQWLATADPAQRAAIGGELHMQACPPDLHVALLHAVASSGGGLSSDEAADLERAEDKRVRSARKTLVVKLVIAAFAFILIGGFLLGVRQAWRYSRSGRWRADWFAQGPEVRLCASLALLPAVLMFASQVEILNSSMRGVSAPLFTLLVWCFVVHVTIETLRLGSRGWYLLLIPLALALPSLLMDAEAGSRAWRFSFWIPICSLPLVLDRFWSWYPDPLAGRRLRCIANSVLVLAFALPYGWLILTPEPSLAGRGTLQWIATISSFLALVIWLSLFTVTTFHRRHEIMKEYGAQNQAAQRARRAAP